MVQGMVPLAVSGSIIVGVAVAGAAALLFVLLRREDRLQEIERRAEQPAGSPQEPEEGV
jgi:hypothetical protein